MSVAYLHHQILKSDKYHQRISKNSNERGRGGGRKHILLGVRVEIYKTTSDTTIIIHESSGYEYDGAYLAKKNFSFFRYHILYFLRYEKKSICSFFSDLNNADS